MYRKIRDMKIYKKDDKVIIELDFWQPINNPYDEREDQGKTHNLIGVVAGDELTISQLNDLAYKGDQQEGSPLIHFYGEEKEFLKICKEIDIDVWTHEICARCKRPTYGSFTFRDEGFICWNCENIN